tara:strand:+ start:115 stop:522 length:408 start_codon:yes stop_codon:yes gene_type:complete
MQIVALPEADDLEKAQLEVDKYGKSSRIPIWGMMESYIESIESSSPNDVKTYFCDHLPFQHRVAKWEMESWNPEMVYKAYQACLSELQWDERKAYSLVFDKEFMMVALRSSTTVSLSIYIHVAPSPTCRSFAVFF